MVNSESPRNGGLLVQTTKSNPETTLLGWRRSLGRTRLRNQFLTGKFTGNFVVVAIQICKNTNFVDDRRGLVPNSCTLEQGIIFTEQEILDRK